MRSELSHCGDGGGRGRRRSRREELTGGPVVQRRHVGHRQHRSGAQWDDSGAQREGRGRVVKEKWTGRAALPGGGGAEVWLKESKGRVRERGGAEGRRRVGLSREGGCEAGQWEEAGPWEEQEGPGKALEWEAALESSAPLRRSSRRSHRGGRGRVRRVTGRKALQATEPHLQSSGADGGSEGDRPGGQGRRQSGGGGAGRCSGFHPTEGAEDGSVRERQR